MLNQLKESPQNVVLIGDAFVSADTMEQAVRESKISIGKLTKLFWGSEDKQEFTSRQLNVERHGPEAEAYADGLEEAAADADIIITHFCPIPAAVIARAPGLKAILTCRGGLEHICTEAASAGNIPVVNVIRNAEPVADFALAMILALTRNIAVSHASLIQGEWVKTFPNSGFTTTLSQLTVGLAGVGNIGIELALRLKALGVKLMAHDAYISRERLEKNGLGAIQMVDSLEELFQTADVISLHLRLTDDTLQMIDKRYFSLMKPTAYFINTARGGLVNQPDLIEALKNRRIAGAALDVFDTEPIDAETGFAGLDNVVLTPHIAGATVDAIPKSPFLLLREVDKILERGVTDRIANYRELSL